MSEPSVDPRPLLPQWLLGLAGVLAFGLLLVELGFRLSITNQRYVMLATTTVLWAGVLAEIGIIIHQPRRLAYLKTHVGPCIVTLLLLVALAGKAQIVPWLQSRATDLTFIRVESIFLGALQAVLLGRLAHRALRINQLLAFSKISPRVLLIGSFVGLILVGAGLLMMPRATVESAHLSWLDALFTSTSAVCVTGLIVVDTATVFTPFGQSVLMVLFQLGGLGLMTFAYFFITAFSGVTLKDRALLSDLLNEEDFGKITSSLGAIFVLTLSFEAIGAILLHASIAPEQANWFKSIFHAISAFCNAGFSVYSLGLADENTVNNYAYQSVIMGLIICGGLGFPVLNNLWERALWVRHDRLRRPPRLTTHSKVVLVATGALIVVGTLLIHGFEFGRSEPGAYTPTLWNALFNAVTARTAGFNTLPMESLAPAAAIMMIGLMFVGAGPASTGGGIKVTTFAISLLNTLRILRRPGDDLVAFGRRIPDELAHRAFAIVLLAMLWVGLTTLCLAALMPDRNALDLAFEAVSAFATVGLSRGLTPALPDMGKIIIILSMLVGRIGILYAALGVAGRASRGRIGYPTASIIIS